MNNIISIIDGKISNDHIKLVNARELHSFLEIGKVFGAWIQNRIEQYNFVENQDYIIRFPNLESDDKGGQNKKEYHISLDMAKELSMVERNEKGKIARKYFIECEKELKNIKNHSEALPDFTNPAIAARAWAEQFEQKLLLEAKVKEDVHKVEFAEAVNETDLLMTVGNFAKMIGLTQNKFFRQLRYDHYLGNTGSFYNKPITKSLSTNTREALIVLKEYISDNEVRYQPYITGVGQLYFQKKYGKISK